MAAGGFAQRDRLKSIYCSGRASRFPRESRLANGVPALFLLSIEPKRGIRHAFEGLVNRLLFVTLILAASSAIGATATPTPFPSTGPTVPGKSAHLRYGKAAAPENAPLAVKRAIWAANQLSSKPYRFGGGHHSFHDNAYDCSGTVSYMLGGAGLIKSPMSSSDFRRFGERGPGKWITVYARNGHTFAIIAGLRLDTTPYHSFNDRWAPRWQSTTRGPSGFEARHPVGL
jgi:hypothetical protein